MSSQVLSPTAMVMNNNNNNSNAGTSGLPFRNPLQQQRDIDRRVLHLNNRACVLVLSNGEYSEAIKLFDTALMIHKEQTEEGAAIVEEDQEPTPVTPQHEQQQGQQQQQQQTPSYEGCEVENNNINNNNINNNTTINIDCSCDSSSSSSCSSDHIIYDEEEDCDEDIVCHDFSEEDISETEFDEDFCEMDWDKHLVVEDDSETSNSCLEGDELLAATATATTPMHHYQHHQLQQQQQPQPHQQQPQQQQQQQPQALTQQLAQSSTKIPRMTTASRLRTLNYCGQQEYHDEHGLKSQHHYHHQVYSLPIVMEESEWDTAPIQDKTFVLIFNTALCNHLWGMQLMQRYISATTTTATTTTTTVANNNTNSNNNSNNNTPAGGEAVAALAEHCRETLTIAKLLYKLALENSVSFANGVDKMCYVALYNNLSHVLKTLEGYDSAEAQWCDDMLLKAIFWWRDSTNHHTSHHGSSSSGHYHASGSSGRSGNSSSSHHNLSTGSHSYGNSNSNSLSDMYLDDDAEIIDAFLENVYYRVGVPENIVPAAAA